jgi:hypothetical protein
VVVDADGADSDAAALVERLLAQAGVDARTVPQVQTQRGRDRDGRRRHSRRISYHFAATERTAAWTLKSGAQLAIDGQLANVDVRTGCDGEGVECVLAPPTTVVGGGQ